MRPVNLIPPEERRDKAPIRTGPVAYLLVGALALALGAVTMLVLTNNKISDRRADIAGLRQQQAAATVQADRLAPFSKFSSVEQQRTATIASLADSRFDWERVMRELARVIPNDVWLTNLSGAVAGATASATSTSSTGGGGSIDTSSIIGPSLQISGCAAGQDSVARFLSALRDIDGVTRVGLASSDLPDSTTSAGATTDSAGGGGGEACASRDFIAQFQIVAAFDAVPAPQIPAAAPSTITATPFTSSTQATPATNASAATTPGS